MSHRGYTTLTEFPLVEGKDIYEVVYLQTQAIMANFGTNEAVVASVFSVLHDYLVFDTFDTIAFSESWDRLYAMYVDRQLSLFIVRSRQYLLDQVCLLIYARSYGLDNSQAVERAIELLWSIATEAGTFINEVSNNYRRGRNLLPPPQ